MMKAYQKSHSWLDFSLNIREFQPRFWVGLGECVSKCDHLQRTAMSDDLRQEIYNLYFTKGAAATTAIEGNTLSEQQVHNIIAGQAEPLPKAYQPMEIQVRNVAALYGEIAANAQQATLLPLSANLICDFQRRILQDLSIAGNIGKVRQRSVVVGDYRGAPYEDCNYLLERLCGWLKEGFSTLEHQIGKKASAIIRAALAHLYIAWIHPFDDGNGRTARMAEFYLLMAAGIPASAAHLLANHCNRLRDTYYAQLAAATAERRPVPFLCFMVEGLRDSLREQLRHVYQEHERLVWHDILEKKITGSEAARRRRIELARLLLKQQETSNVKALINHSDIGILYAATKSGAGVLYTDMEYLVQANIVSKESGGYRVNRQLIHHMKPPVDSGQMQA